MTEYRRIFLDTSPIIYYLQETEIYFEQMRKFFISLRKTDTALVSSDITIAEYCVYPYKIGNLELIKAFDTFVRIVPLEIISTSEWIAKKAARIRATYPAFKPMDSLQLATAVLGDCDLFLTNDKQLRQFTEIKCLTIDDFFSEGVES